VIYAAVAFLLISGVATFFIARACVAVVATRREQTALYKQSKQMLKSMQQTEATAKRVLDRAYRYQEKLDVLLLDPKVQAALNRHNGEV
jgi:hypothetical protein